MTAPSTFALTGTWTEPSAAASAGTITVKPTKARFINNGNVINGKSQTFTLDAYGQLGVAPRSAADGVTNSDTSLVSATAAFTAADVGKTVTGTGTHAADIFAGTTIATVTNSTTVVLSHATTGTHTAVGFTLSGGGVTLIQATAGYDVTVDLTGHHESTQHIAGTGNLSITPSSPSNMTVTGKWYTSDNTIAAGTVDFTRSSTGTITTGTLDGSGTLGSGVILPQDSAGYDVQEKITGQASRPSYHIAATTSSLDLSTIT